MKILLLMFLSAGQILAQAGSIGMSNFGGLNDTDASAVIDPKQSQDCLNVEANLSGTALLKRKGYSKEATLTYTTAAVNGSYYFQNDGGDKIKVVCHDRVCSKSVNDTTFATFLTTAAAGINRWTFVTVDGDLYGANDQRDAVFKYTGSAFTSPSGIPAGSILELSQDRLIVADTSADPNRVSFSKSGDYATFTAGTDEVDSWYDEFGSAGDRITGLKYHKGTLFVFKRTSIISCIVDNQYNTQCNTVSNSIGTTEPNSIISAGDGIYFKAQDNSYWQIANNGLGNISLQVSNMVKSQQSGAQRNNTQSSQDDWEAGTQTPLSSWYTTTVSGSIYPSTWTAVDTSSTNFNAGSFSTSISSNIAGALYLRQLSSGVFTNAGGETTQNPLSTNWTVTTGAAFTTAIPTVTNKWGNNGIEFNGYPSSPGKQTLIIKVMDINSNILISKSYTVSNVNFTLMVRDTIDTSTLTVSQIKIQVENKMYPTDDIIYSAPIIRPTNITFGYAYPVGHGTIFDMDETTTLTTTGTFTSQIFDTGFPTPTYGQFDVTMTSNTTGKIVFYAQSSTSTTGTWSTLVSQVNGSTFNATPQRYIRYVSTFSVTSATDTVPILYDATLHAVTTGQFYTQCIQPGTSISAWGKLSCAETKSGSGGLTYYVRADKACSYLSTGTWSAQTNNATIGVSTNPAIQVRFDSSFSSLTSYPTDQAQVDACTLYWTEGTPAQSVWGTYDSLKNSIYWTATTTNSTTSDRIVKYDLNLQQWFPFGIPATALNYIDGNIYFGGAAGGYWYKYGGINNDNGSNINAYWKSKDFAGTDPFKETIFQKISLVAKNNVTGSLNVNYALGNNINGVYTINLGTTSTTNYVRSNYNLPIMSPYNFMNIRVGNNSQEYFEVLGIKIDLFQQPWRVLSQ